MDCQYSYMAKLGKPKGSRNKKTLEKLLAAASKTAVQDSHGRTENSNSYPELNNELQLFPHTGPFGNFPGSEAHPLPGQLDPELFSVSDMLVVILAEPYDR